MSTESTKIRRDIDPPQPIILKGFSDEPLQLLAIFDRGDSIELAPTQSDEPMPFQPESVFEFDQQLFAELRQAADTHDERRLSKAWKLATPFKKSA